MSIQNINSSTAALNAQVLQGNNSNSDSTFSSADLPQLSSSQIQQLQQALTQDVQQAFASGASGSGLQSTIDNSASNTLGQFGFSQTQTQTVLDKLNQAAGGQGQTGRAHHGGRGHGRRQSQQVINSLIQTLQNSANSQTTGSSDSTNPTNTLLSAITSSPSTSSGQGVDLSA